MQQNHFRSPPYATNQRQYQFTPAQQYPDCCDCGNCCTCDYGACCCRSAYGPYGQRLNLAKAFGCVAILLLIVAFYASLISNSGKLPNVADPDAWKSNYSIALPILMVTAVAILPFSIIYSILFKDRARQEEVNARREMNNTTIEEETQDLPVVSTFFATLGFVLGLVGAVLYATGFGKVNGKVYETPKVIGLLLMIVGSVLLPVASIFVVIKGRHKYMQYRVTSYGMNPAPPVPPTMNRTPFPQHQSGNRGPQAAFMTPKEQTTPKNEEPIVTFPQSEDNLPEETNQNVPSTSPLNSLHQLPLHQQPHSAYPRQPPPTFPPQPYSYPPPPSYDAAVNAPQNSPKAEPNTLSKWKGKLGKGLVEIGKKL